MQARRNVEALFFVALHQPGGGIMLVLESLRLSTPFGNAKLKGIPAV